MLRGSLLVLCDRTGIGTALLAIKFRYYLRRTDKVVESAAKPQTAHDASSASHVIMSLAAGSLIFMTAGPGEYVDQSVTPGAA